VLDGNPLLLFVAFSDEPKREARGILRTCRKNIIIITTTPAIRMEDFGSECIEGLLLGALDEATLPHTFGQRQRKWMNTTQQQQQHMP